MPTSTPQNVGYLALLRQNANFRNLWLGNLVSLLGDWFNTIALYALIVQLTGSPLALGAVFITKLLPWAVVAPLAGVLVDRFNRRRLMIISDLLRGVVVIGFLFIDEADEVGWIYVLLAAQVIFGSVFQPAKSASLPNITSARELLTANAIMAATWSTMLAVGAALGGFAAEAFGYTFVFVFDSLTYFVSAFFIYRTVIPQETEAPAEGSPVATAFREIMDGWRHLRASDPIRRIAFAKFTWAFAGGGLVYMLALIGEAVSTEALAAGIGVLFMARGIGTGIGPIVARAVFRDSSRWPLVLGVCVVVSGIFYGLVGLVPWSTAPMVMVGIIVLVMVAHASSGANWVLSSVILQERTADRYRGRVFATEWLLYMVADVLSILLASLLLQFEWVDLRTAVKGFGVLQIVCGFIWIAYVVPRERRLLLARPTYATAPNLPS